MNRILVAGIGNIFFGDDAFGLVVVEELKRSELPPEVEVLDFGIRGYDLAYTIMDGYAATILVDATTRGNEPGTLYLIEPSQEDIAALGTAAPDGHSLGPVQVIQFVQSLGGQISSLYLVGCEPALLETDDGQMGLSEPVRGAVPGAVEMIRRLTRELVEKTGC
jgi:hydrogenase maturation protease